MKFFELQEAPELKYAPNLESWYGKFDVKDISLENYYKLPVFDETEKLFISDKKILTEKEEEYMRTGREHTWVQALAVFQERVHILMYGVIADTSWDRLVLHAGARG